MKQSDWAFEMWIWQYSNTGSFYSQLISLYAKGDIGNKFKLSFAFSGLKEIWDSWSNSESPEAFFNSYETTKGRVSNGKE